MTRKEFLKLTAGAALVPGIAFLSGCKSTTTPDNNNPDQRTFTSTSVDGHTHTVQVTKSEIEAAAGFVKTTSSSNGHYHTFTMTAAEVTAIKNGTTTVEDTTNVSGHSHQIAISKWY